MHRRERPRATQSASKPASTGKMPQVSLNQQQWQALTVGLPWRKLGAATGIGMS